MTDRGGFNLHRQARLRAVVASLGLLLSGASLRADDWPQWLGPERDSVWRETGILERFPEGGPKVRWRTKIGAGYSEEGKRAYNRRFLHVHGALERRFVVSLARSFRAQRDRVLSHFPAP